MLPGFDPRLREHVTLTSGDWPAPVEGTVPGTPVVEIVFADAVADAMEWELGEERRVPAGDGEQQVRLVGTVAAVDPGDGFWTHVPLSLEPSVVIVGLGPPEITGVAFVDPASWSAFSESRMVTNMQAWFPVVVDRISADETGMLIGQLDEFSSDVHAIGGGSQDFWFATVGDVGFSSGLRDALLEASRAASASDAVLATIASGPIGVMVAVLVLGARVVFERRRLGLELAAARGASPGQLRGILAIEGLAIGVPAALVGGVAGTLAIAADAGWAGWLIAAVFALTPAVLLVSAAPALSPLRRARADLGAPARSRFRWIAEALIAVLAAVALVLLLRRGLVTSTAATGVDPLLAAVPLLLSLLACVLVLRLYPAAARGPRAPGGPPCIARAVPRLRAGAPRPVGRSRAGARRRRRASRSRCSPPCCSAPCSRESLAPPTRRWARMPRCRAPRSPSTSGQPSPRCRASRRSRRCTPPHPRASASTDAAARPPSSWSTPPRCAQSRRGGSMRHRCPPELSGPGDDGVPVVLSRVIASAIEGADDLELDGEPFETVGVVDGSTAYAPRASWILIDRANAEPFTDTLVPRTVLVRFEPGADAERVTAALAEIAGPEAEVTTPDDLRAELDAKPTTRGLVVALIAAIVLASLLTALAIVLTLVVGRPARERLLPLLTTLGLSRRGERALVAWEIGPVAAVAVVAGAAARGAAAAHRAAGRRPACVHERRPATGRHLRPVAHRRRCSPVPCS